MDRRASTGGRQARKELASPYARPASPAPRATPSRLRTVLSYLSPFSKPKQPQPEPEPESEDELDEQEYDEQPEAQFALHGQSLAHVGDATMNEHEENAPPSPTPYGQSLYPSLSSLAASHSMPNLASAATTPRFPGNFAPPALNIPTARQATPSAWGGSESQFDATARSPPAGRATEELARFFREKADRGDEPLTAVEQAGVFALMQQAQTEALPTAFTPHFGARNSPPTAQSFAPQSALSASTSTARFGSPAPTASSSAAFRRRRPIYVGAGYSSQAARRRKANAAASNGEGGLTRSQSAGMVYEMSGSKSQEPSVADGKRRKLEDDEDAPPTSALDAPVAASPFKSGPASAAAKLAPAPKPTVISTPARPSPLWQVSQADTPSPSPPKKPTATAPARPPTRAADIMMDIIREEDAARPKVTRQEVLNPYESADNPMARIPRSRPPRPTTPHRAPPSAKKAAPPPAKDISPLEQLERTMPAEYRRDDGKRARPTPISPPKKVAPPPVPVPKAAKAKAAPVPVKKAAVETIELSDSSDEQEEEDDAEMEDELDEDEDEDDQDEEEDEDEEEEESPPPVLKQTAHKSKAASKQSSTFAPAPSAFKKAPSPTPKRKAASPEPVAPPKVASIFAPQQPAAPAPSAPFTFSVAPAAAPATSPCTAEMSEDDARKSALQIARSALPAFSFVGAFAGCESKKEEDAAIRGVQDLVRAMSRSEIPTVAL